MKSYRAYFPITAKMSPIDYVVRDSPMETKEECALWHYNRSREHDGLPALERLPKGVVFKVIN